MVCVTEKPNFREASCCRVEVVKGVEGDFFAGAEKATPDVSSTQSEPRHVLVF
jgi:hypothetical protein